MSGVKTRPFLAQVVLLWFCRHRLRRVPVNLRDESPSWSPLVVPVAFRFFLLLLFFFFFLSSSFLSPRSFEAVSQRRLLFVDEADVLRGGLGLLRLAPPLVHLQLLGPSGGPGPPAERLRGTPRCILGVPLPSAGTDKVQRRGQGDGGQVEGGGAGRSQLTHSGGGRERGGSRAVAGRGRRRGSVL